MTARPMPRKPSWRRYQSPYSVLPASALLIIRMPKPLSTSTITSRSQSKRRQMTRLMSAPHGRPIHREPVGQPSDQSLSPSSLCPRIEVRFEDLLGNGGGHAGALAAVVNEDRDYDFRIA